MRVVYLLEDTPLFGGVKVVLRQADLLVRRGHDVVVVSPGEPPAWCDLQAQFLRTTGLEPHEIPEADVTVATYWTTIARALAGATGEVVHYCQGFEASYTHNVAEHPSILDAYKKRLPAIVVAPHLGKMLAKRFGRPSQVVKQPLEAFWKPDPRRHPNSVPRVLVTSPYEIDWKGVSTALRAVRALRSYGFSCELVRLSQWPLSESERTLLSPDEFHEHVLPQAVPEIMASCDLLLAPSWEQEGFGLPVLEAMASGVPVVASDIACFRDFATPAARLVPFDQPDAFAAAAREILNDSGLWLRMKQAGRDVANQFKETASAREAEQAMRWVASGGWRKSLTDART